MYISSNIRPDILSSVHQCAHFNHNTKVSHEISVNKVAKYKGILLNPNNIIIVYFYVDEDLAGLWGHENTQNYIFAKRSTGFVVIFFRLECIVGFKATDRDLSFYFLLVQFPE